MHKSEHFPATGVYLVDDQTAMKRRLMYTAAALVVCTFGCRKQTATQNDDLARSAKEARRAGKTATTLRYILDESGTEGALDDFLRTSSVVIVTRAAPQPIQTIDEGYLYTWHVLHVLRILSQRPPFPRDGCELAKPPRLPVNSNEIAIPLVAGTAIVDGVAVTMDSNESHITFESGKSYLLLARVCPNGVARLPQGAADVFQINDGGRIASVDSPQFNFMKELLSFGTVDRLGTYLQKFDASGRSDNERKR